MNATSGEGDISVKFNGSDNLVVSSTDINAALGGVISGVTNGLSETAGVARLGGALTQATTITGNDACSLTFTDAAVTNKRGILYGGDYSLTYVARSLVDAAYVTGLTNGLDSRLDVIEPIYVTGATNGLSKSGAHLVELGGVLTDETTIVTSGATFILDGGNTNKFQQSASGTKISYGTGISSNCINVDDFGIWIQSTEDNICITSTQGGDIDIYSNNDFFLSFSGASINDTHPSSPSGLTYYADYSATFVDNSLITKKYVATQVSGITANAITSASNGLTKVGQDVQLGGDLSGNTIIDTNSFNFTICDSDGSASRLSILDGGLSSLQTRGGTQNLILSNQGSGSAVLCSTGIACLDASSVNLNASVNCAR